MAGLGTLGFGMVGFWGLVGKGGVLARRGGVREREAILFSLVWLVLVELGSTFYSETC